MKTTEDGFKEEVKRTERRKVKIGRRKAGNRVPVLKSDRKYRL